MLMLGARGSDSREFIIRVLMALVLAPLGVGSVVLGGYVLMLVLAILVLGAAFEWTRMAAGVERKPNPLYLSLNLLCGLAALWFASNSFLYTLAIIALGAVVAASLSTLAKRDRTTWVFGTVYTSLPFAAFFWVRDQAPGGEMLAIGLLVVVWTTDIAAYFAGRGFGGPLLSPLDSPNKTWTGAIGALICACLAGAAVARAIQAPVEFWVVASIVISVVAQSGDLLESRLKRKFGVKDTSGFIPGHGGVLDRLDALMAASAVTAIVLWSLPHLAQLLTTQQQA